MMARAGGKFMVEVCAAAVAFPALVAAIAVVTFPAVVAAGALPAVIAAAGAVRAVTTVTEIAA